MGRQVRNASALLTWIRQPSNAVPEGTGIWEDIFAELHRLEKSRRAEQERLTAALVRFQSAGTAMPDAVVILDAGNRIDWCNPMAERFFGIDSSRDAGQPVINLVRAPDFAGYLQQDAFNEPLVIRLTRGEELMLSIRVIPYGQDQKLLLCRDITQASRLETMRRDFVANVSHELKTPLTVVSGFLETLADGEVRLPESRTREVFTLMEQQTQRMLQLIEDLLTLSALESSPGLANDSPVDVCALLQSLLDEGLALSAGRHEISLEAQAGLMVSGSATELRSAFGNLMANAVRYTPGGGIVRMTWRLRASGEAEFAVEDSGVGFEARHIPRLTERFYRIDQGRSRETGGTGLGLAIVKHVLTRHQAQLEIASEPGRGSRFGAVFPVRRVSVSSGSSQVTTSKLARS
jgi:two-component system phosphate regulon sensor histidine kinase PhoR